MYFNIYKKKIIIFFWSTIICCLFKTFEFYFFICYFYSKRVRNCDKANLSHVKKHPFSVENQALAEHLSILASYFDILCVKDHLLISYVNSHVQNTSINFIWNIKCLEIQWGNNKVYQFFNPWHINVMFLFTAEWQTNVRREYCR